MGKENKAHCRADKDSIGPFFRCRKKLRTHSFELLLEVSGNVFLGRVLFLWL